MKITNLLLALALGALFFLASCKDDEAASGCTRCSFDILTVNCYVDVCDDGSTSTSGGTTCATLEASIQATSTTKEEKIADLEAFGCDCK